jgi:hypothetical protein
MAKPKLLPQVTLITLICTDQRKATDTQGFAGGARWGRHLVKGSAAETVRTVDVRWGTVDAAGSYAGGSGETTVHSFLFFRGQLTSASADQYTIVQHNSSFMASGA